ncbi:MAG: DNA repair protein RadA [Firmicutes bacterium]|nr:DNA repair protein RadA [Bacillota bacterium]MCL5065356.1 DNA repair protein RadA [Bacillota bacterium]
MVEHLVDVVLMFEGDRQHVLRVLRGTKNRFGSTSELGLFAMEGEGLVPVPDPSRALLAERPTSATGSVVVATIEGTRPLLVEVQALLVRAYGSPRRVVSGMDPQRVALVLAVMERHLGFRVSDMDVYFKLTGGVSVEDPALDLGVALAAASSLSGVPVPGDVVVLGEVGLTGEIRRVGRVVERLNEALHLGFSRALVPVSADYSVPMRIEGVARLEQAVHSLGMGPGNRRQDSRTDDRPGQ